MSVWGVASLAGLEAGLWDSRETLDSLRGEGEVFSSQLEGREGKLEEYRKWLDACCRFTSWHSDNSHI